MVRCDLHQIKEKGPMNAGLFLVLGMIDRAMLWG
jgi:hypothetical protein